MTTDLRDKTVDELREEQLEAVEGSQPYPGDGLFAFDELARRLAEAEQQIAERDATLAELSSRWNEKTVALLEEANRIRRTVKVATDAEARCNVRAEIYEKCANELLESLPATAKANAEILRTAMAQEEQHKLYSSNPNGCQCDTCKAVRAAKEITIEPSTVHTVKGEKS